ncbi:hypothetical protein, partial [Xanthomonas sp. SHU 308]|uniref:hypothetical protein n=1 Tax=Xanthomonas sp. SHU 308 TaxID=1591201 RepID=UPI001E304333
MALDQSRRADGAFQCPRVPRSRQRPSHIPQLSATAPRVAASALRDAFRQRPALGCIDIHFSHIGQESQEMRWLAIEA